MSILARFSPEHLTSQQYEEVKRQLDEQGDWPPDGLELHTCFGTDGELRVSEIWASEEKMQAFGQRLMPVLEKVGVQQASPPEILPVVRFESY